MEVLELQTPSPIPHIHLPHHVLFSEILVRLPIKSLIRFKAVSKEWKSIISSPEFARYHLYFQCSSPNYSPKLLFLLPVPNPTDGSVPPRRKSYWVFDYAAYNKGGNHLYEIDPSPEVRADVWGCSDGLVLLASVCFHVWNPATQESRSIPKPTFRIHFRSKVGGFGYVSSIDDYKIVYFSVRSDYDTDVDYNAKYEAEAITFCLKAGTWKRVGFFVPDLCWSGDSRAGVLVNETTYWLLRNSFKKWCIVGFGLASEKFIELEPPPEWMEQPGIKGHLLSVIEGCLCFCSFERYTGRVDISMLKEHGESSSWVKFYRFNHVIVDTPLTCLSVSGLWSDKFIIYTSTESTALIDMNQDPPVAETLTAIRRLAYSPDHLQFHYVESLASPFGGVVDNNKKDDGIVADNLMESSKKVPKIKSWVLVVHAIILVISIIAFAIRQVN